MKHVYGAETPARGILKAMYTSILLVSLGLVPAVFIDGVRAFGCIESCRHVWVLSFPESRV
ncbi:Cacna1g [Symbiodinium sp. CCMP2456]|nr:Cacna1g [Symbiodinium sp. CCMP2456]